MKNPETEAISGFCCKLHCHIGGERGIRTPGSVVTDQRFSRPPHSTALPFLRRKDNIFLFLEIFFKIFT
jgi:hypothetical protein